VCTQSGAAKKEKEEEKTTKQLMEDYEYELSIQKLAQPVQLSGRKTIEQEIEDARAKLKVIARLSLFPCAPN